MKLKILVVISLFMFWSLFTAIVVAGLLSKNYNQLANNRKPATDSGDQSQIILSVAEIAKHNTVSNCWLIISDKVYDVSGYLQIHPGGSSAITPYCGKDGTQAFATKDLKSTKDHSSLAHNLLKDYFIGNLNQEINNPISGITPSPTSKVLPTSTLAPIAKSNVILTSTEVAKHNTNSDCWLVISNNVYNLTNYLSSHPGGISTISPYCGKDGTQGFATRGGTGTHSSFASSLFGNYLIGSLNQSVGSASIQNTQSITPPSTQREEEDDD